MTRRKTTPAPVRPYTVLRDARLLGTAEPFAGHAAATAPAAPSPSPLALPGRPRVSVETRILEPREVGVVARDPSVVGVAPVMPTRLIEPFESAALAAGEASWGIGAVGAAESSFTGEGVLVAVLDTGIDADHPAFSGVTLVEQDFSGDGNGDANGHGTHCAGTVFGRDVEGTRIGVARGVERALIGKVLGNDGRGESDWIYRAISWAVGEGAKVVSMSLGFDYYAAFRWYLESGYPEPAAVSQALVDYRANLRAFDALMVFAQAHALTTGGVVFAAAAGNESERGGSPPYEVAASLPAAATGVVSVGALGRGAAGLRVAPFSNTFPQVSAPGVDIVSAKAGGGLRPLSGTSMAAPHVAGVAALWWQALPGLGGLANATNVVAELLGGAVTAGFEAGTDPADRGAGIIAAP